MKTMSFTAWEETNFLVSTIWAETGRKRLSLTFKWLSISTAQTDGSLPTSVFSMDSRVDVIALVWMIDGLQPTTRSPLEWQAVTTIRLVQVVVMRSPSLLFACTGSVIASSAVKLVCPSLMSPDQKSLEKIGNAQPDTLVVVAFQTPRV